jgi:hypothetical protein
MFSLTRRNFFPFTEFTFRKLVILQSRYRRPALNSLGGCPCLRNHLGPLRLPWWPRESNAMRLILQISLRLLRANIESVFESQPRYSYAGGVGWLEGCGVLITLG